MLWKTTGKTLIEKSDLRKLLLLLNFSNIRKLLP